METYLPIIKTLLSEWWQLTLTYPMYAAALAVTVWLLTAILYSIRIASLNRKNKASEKARIEMHNNLNAAQQKMQQMQEELAANTGQMQKDKQLAENEAQRAAGLEEQLSLRNKQIAGTIQTLATSFDLGERPLPVTEDIKAEGLWQQHDRVIALLTTRLHSEQQAKAELQQSYQAETLKRAENQALLETLQTNLATQTGQIFKLEQALAEQKSMLQQQEEKSQQVLSQTLEKHLSELAHLTELEQQALELVNARQQLTELEEKLLAKNALIVQLEKNKAADQVKAQAQAAVIKPDEKETTIKLQKTDEETPPTPSDIKQQPVSSVKEQVAGVTGKLKNLFGKTRPEPMTAEPESAETKPDKVEIQSVPMDVEQPPVSAAKSQLGKLKNLLGSKQQSVATKQDEINIQPAPSDVEQPPVNLAKDKYGRIKHYFGDTKQQSEDAKQDEAESQPAPVEVEQQLSVSPAKGQLGKLKNLFGSKRAEEELQPTPSELEQQSVNPVKGKLGKLKNLFGKTK